MLNVLNLKAEYYSVTFIIYIIIFYVAYRIGRWKILKVNEPFENLFMDVIKGKITDPEEIRDIYVQIDREKRKKLL